MKSSEKSNNRGIAFLITSIILLLILGWMTFNTVSLNNKTEVLENRVDSLHVINKEIDSLLVSAQEEITRFKEEINSKDSIINVLQEMLEEKETRIKALSREVNAVPKLRKELAELKKFKTELLYKIKLLEERNAILENEKLDLTNANEDLKKKIAELEEKLGILSKKVEKGSVLKITSLSIVTEKKDKKGAYVVVKKAKKADRLTISFDINENHVADEGPKQLYIRVFDPKGKLMEGPESGSFTNADDNLSVPYTRQEKVTFANNKQRITVPVEINNIEPTKGDYKVEVYADGHFSGSGKIALK
jgi:hypothetical protein